MAMVLKHQKTDSKSPKIDEHYREIGIPAVRASVRYVLRDSSAVLTNTFADHKGDSRSIQGTQESRRRR